MCTVLNFTLIRFSQPRHTMQTCGIADARYYSPERGAAVWWEAKTEIGSQSAFQKAFQALVESCGEEYVVGTDAALHEWAIRKGYVERIGPDGMRVIRAA